MTAMKASGPDVTGTARVSIGRPAPTEYADNVAHYVARVPETDPLGPMAEQAGALMAMLAPVTE